MALRVHRAAVIGATALLTVASAARGRGEQRRLTSARLTQLPYLPAPALAGQGVRA